MINQVIYPKMGERYGAEGTTAALVALVESPTLATAYLMSAVLGAAYLSLPIVPLLLPQYAAGIPTARILFAGFYFLSLVGGSANFLVTINRQAQYLASLLIAILLGLLLNAIALAADLGIIGIAATTGIMYVVYAFGIIGFTAQRYLNRSLAQALALCGRLLLPFALAAMLIFFVARLHLSGLILTTIVQLLAFLLPYALLSSFLLRGKLRP
jgi:O-antigen/teichoic acid export membrane protein